MAEVHETDFPEQTGLQVSTPYGRATLSNLFADEAGEPAAYVALLEDESAWATGPVSELSYLPVN